MPVRARRNLLVFVNPHSGPGKAIQIFHQRVAPIFAEASVTYDLVLTEKQNFGFEYVQSFDPDRWSGIVIVSGDGLIYEVINGIMRRPDWATTIKMPIGVIPGGSGNGLAKSIAYAVGEPSETHPVLLGALNVIKGRLMPMDLIRIQTPKRTIYSFLSIGWGIMADIDIESERLRIIGETRFTVWALARIIGLRIYRGRISYLPIEGSITLNQEKGHSRKHNEKNKQAATNIAYKRRRLHRKRAKTVPHKLQIQDAYYEDDSEDDLLNDVTWPTDALEITGNGPAIRDLNSRNGDAANGNIPSTSREDDAHYSGDSSEFEDLSPSDLPSLGQPVPSNWTQIEDNFVSVYAVYQTHIGSDLFVAPSAKMDDGIIWLLIIRQGVSRSQLVNFLLSLESGGHVTLPCVSIIPVRAFRLEPMTPGKYLTVDGEAIEYGPIQAEVLPSMVRIMTL